MKIKMNVDIGEIIKKIKFSRQEDKTDRQRVKQKRKGAIEFKKEENSEVKEVENVYNLEQTKKRRGKKEYNENDLVENGEKKKKAALGDLKEVCLPSFLLGVWHYVVMNRRDNAVGKKTYDVWCPSNDRAPRKYTAHMGEGLLDSLTTYTVDTKETITAEVVDEPIEDDASDATGQDTPPVTQQMVNNNPTFFNINISGGNNSFYQHVDKLTINNGGKQDE